MLWCHDFTFEKSCCFYSMATCGGPSFVTEAADVNRRGESTNARGN